MKNLFIFLLLSLNLAAQTSDSTLVDNKKLIGLAVEKKAMRDSINILVQLIDSQAITIHNYSLLNTTNTAIISAQKTQLDIFKGMNTSKVSWYNHPTVKFIEGALYTFAIVLVASKI